MGFLCVPLGSSTVQLHDSLRSRRSCTCSEVGFSSQNVGRTWGVCTNKERLPLCAFCGQKDSMQRIFINKCFLFTMGSVCRVKRFISRWQTFRWWWRGWNESAEGAETTVKRLLCCGFRRSGKAMGQVYQWWWRICREINVSSRLKYHIFYILYPFANYLLTFPRIFSRSSWGT
jgi:hypothetical protein